MGRMADRDRHPLVAAYHRLLVWDIMARPAATRWAERALNPVLGKSLVAYFRKPDAADGAGSGSDARAGAVPVALAPDGVPSA